MGSVVVGAGLAAAHTVTASLAVERMLTPEKWPDRRPAGR